MRRPFRLYRSEVTHCFPSPPSTEKQQEEKMMGRDVYRVDVCLEDALSSAELMMNPVLVGRPR